MKSPYVTSLNTLLFINIKPKDLKHPKRFNIYKILCSTINVRTMNFPKPLHKGMIVLELEGKSVDDCDLLKRRFVYGSQKYVLGTRVRALFKATMH